MARQVWLFGKLCGRVPDLGGNATVIPMSLKLPEVEMFQNDWYLKREAEERIKSSLRSAEASRLAKLALESKQHAYQHVLARLGGILSRTGDYLQTHFGTGLPIDQNHFSSPGSSREVAAHAAPSIHRFDCP